MTPTMLYLVGDALQFHRCVARFPCFCSRCIVLAFDSIALHLFCVRVPLSLFALESLSFAAAWV